MQISISRIEAIGGLRFFLIFYIINAHFVQIATSDLYLLRLFKQHNMLVGAFFVLSGFVMTYSYFQRENFTPFAWIPYFFYLLKRVLRIYPVYLCVILLFLPMYIYLDLYYGDSCDLLWHFVICLSLFQAWFPSYGLLWNSPTWFLSVILFCSAMFPFLVRILFRLKRREVFIWILSFVFFNALFRSSYAIYIGWDVLEEVSRSTRVSWLFNLVRFNPLLNLLEFSFGMGIARIYILYAHIISKWSFVNHVAYLVSILIIVLIISKSFIPVNDMLIRSCLFIPLFGLLVILLSSSTTKLKSVLEHPYLVYLGHLSFSLYVFHGAWGQLLYKKIMIKNIWGQAPSLFFYYLGLIIPSVLIYHGIEKRLGDKLLNLILKK